MVDETKHLFEFGSFRFDPRERSLRHDGVAVSLTPKASELLLILLENCGRLVEKQFLMQKLWPDSFVEEGNLSFNIHRIRTALRNGVSGKQYIENVPKRGYRFIAEVRLVEDETAKQAAQIAKAESEERQVADSGAAGMPATETPVVGSSAQKLNAVGTRNRWWTRYAIGAALAAVVVVALLVYSHASEASAPRVVSSGRLTTDGHLKAGPLWTDGVRIYFYELTNDGADLLKSVPVVGGETTDVGGTVANFFVRDISPSGAWFLGEHREPNTADRELWEIPVAGGSPRRVGEIFCRDAAWSPDGEWISYAHENGVYVAKADGAGARRVAALGSPPYWVRWSPDGKRIRFLITETPSHKDTLWEVSSAGANLHPVLQGWEKSDPSMLGGWTPAGDYFVFSAMRDGHYDNWALPEKKSFLRNAPQDPLALDLGPMEFYSLVPSKSPNELFAMGVSERNETVRYDANSGRFAPFLKELSAYWVEFSRDERWIAYTSYPEENLWRSRPNGSEKQQLTFAPMHVVGLAWSPDGKRIAFRGRKPNGPWRLYVINADGGDPEELQTRNGEMGVPTWSADGTQIVFGETTPAFNLPKGNEEIHIYDFKTREVSALTGSNGLWSSRWSPDGRYIAALGTIGQELKLYDCNTKKWRSLGFGTVNEMTWTHDGQSIIAETDGATPTLFRISIKTGKAQRIVGMKELSVKGVMTGFTLAPDDSPIALRELGTAEIYSLKLEKH